MTNKQVVTAFLERTFNDRDPAGAGRALADGFVFHNGRDLVTGVSGWVRFAEGWLRGFPDLRIEVTFLMAEDDRVLACWLGTGTHRGEFRGVAGTGHRIEASGMTLFQLSEDRIVEMWDSPNALGQPESLRVVE
jgi:predicted ester cyclase